MRAVAKWKGPGSITRMGRRRGLRFLYSKERPWRPKWTRNYRLGLQWIHSWSIGWGIVCMWLLGVLLWPSTSAGYWYKGNRGVTILQMAQWGCGTTFPPSTKLRQCPGVNPPFFILRKPKIKAAGWSYSMALSTISSCDSSRVSCGSVTPTGCPWDDQDLLSHFCWSYCNQAYLHYSVYSTPLSSS